MTVEQIVEQIEKATAPSVMGRDKARDFMEQVRDEISIRLEALREDMADD